ncbi:solute carrier family 22 member 18-like [Physella acuta]|uniref:solute carrier family 22 member 18-like n=1 Tax=Physella acuta TaxID=109671 RepID=UPI0027DC84DC|nr:solute carrier family 22 member 18-like [Physella acuta]
MSELRTRYSTTNVDKYDHTMNSEQDMNSFDDTMMEGHSERTATTGNMPTYSASDMKVDSSREEDDLDTPRVRLFGRSFNRVVMMTHFNIFLYSSAFWIQTAVFPYLSKELGADPVVFGYLQTTFAVVQLAGGPVFGRFGDLFGSRIAMMLSFVAAAASYFLLAVSTNIPLLFLSRLPSVFMHAMQAGQMIVTDVCVPKQRADALGKLGLSYGIGMVIGPVIGGLIAKFFSLEKATVVACILSLVSIAITYIYIPASIKKATPAETDNNVFNIKKILELMAAPGAIFLIIIKVATGIPIGIFQSMFSIVALDMFKLPAEQNSYIMSYIGIMAMIVQGVGIGVVTKRFSELNILFGSAFILTVSYLMLSFVTTIWQMCFVFIPLITGLTFQNVVTTSALTHTVSVADTGAMLGLSMAVNSLIRSLSPTVGGYMLKEYGFESFGYLGFVTSFIVTAVLFVRKRAELD